MKGRLLHTWICECGCLMPHWDGPVAPRRMACDNPKCQHFGIPYMEPQFELRKFSVEVKEI